MGMQAHRRRAAETERMVDAAVAEVKAEWDSEWERLRAEKRAADAKRKSLRDHQLDRREEAGLPVLSCPNCGERGARHWVPDSLDEHELRVPGYYTCDGDDAT